MSLITSRKDGMFIVMPDAKLDTNTSAEAEKAVIDAVDTGETKMIFDFSKTEYISSAGLRVILKAAKLLKPKSGQVVMCKSNKQIDEVLEISGFLTMIKCYKTLDSAISALS